MCHVSHTGGVILAIGMSLSDSGSRDIADIFNFRSNSPVLTVVGSDVLDRETITSYSFTIVATDAATGMQTSTANVTVNLLDVNDQTPVITNSG
jgi:hypothetical protein